MAFMGDGRSQSFHPPGGLCPQFPFQVRGDLSNPQGHTLPCSADYVRRAFDLRVSPRSLFRPVTRIARGACHEALLIEIGFAPDWSEMFHRATVFASAIIGHHKAEDA